MNSHNSLDVLLDYSLSLLDHAYEVIDRHSELDLGSYSESVGPHLRHVIEHYEALMSALRTEPMDIHSPLVDYDARAREPRFERDPYAAQMRRRGLQTCLQRLRGNGTTTFAQTVTVRSLIGHTGAIELFVQSTISRELIFLASHTVHHFALLEALARARGASFGANFGRAPATVANDRLTEKHG